MLAALFFQLFESKIHYFERNEKVNSYKTTMAHRRVHTSIKAHQSTLSAKN